MKQRTDKEIVSMILAVIGLLLFWMPYFGIIFSLLARAMDKQNQLARVGMWVNIVVLALMFIAGFLIKLIIKMS